MRDKRELKNGGYSLLELFVVSEIWKIKCEQFLRNDGSHFPSNRVSYQGGFGLSITPL